LQPEPYKARRPTSPRRTRRKLPWQNRYTCLRMRLAPITPRHRILTFRGPHHLPHVHGFRWIFFCAGGAGGRRRGAAARPHRRERRAARARHGPLHSGSQHAPPTQHRCRVGVTRVCPCHAWMVTFRVLSCPVLSSPVLSCPVLSCLPQLQACQGRLVQSEAAATDIATALAAAEARGEARTGEPFIVKPPIRTMHRYLMLTASPRHVTYNVRPCAGS